MNPLHRASRTALAVAGAGPSEGAPHRRSAYALSKHAPRARLAVWLATALAALGGSAAMGVNAASAATPPSPRVWEKVSPSDKNDGDIAVGAQGYPVFSSVSAGRVAYSSSTSFGGAASSPLTVQYLADHRADGWHTSAISPPVVDSSYAAVTFGWWTPDLSFATVQTEQGPPLTSGADPDAANLYLRDSGDGSYRLITVTAPPNPPDPNGGYKVRFEGASDDLTHVIFTANDQLTPDAPTGSHQQSLYERVNGQLRLVGVLPDGSAADNSIALGGPTGTFRNAISDDGSRIWFTASSVSNADNGQLYLRMDGSTTVHVNASQKTNGSGPNGTDPNGPLQGSYVGAAADGSAAFFVTPEQLTNDSTAANFTQELYRFDAANATVTDLTVDTNGDPNGADVRAVLGVSDDGAYVYFVAGGVLDSGAVLDNNNLYVWHDGSIRFIGGLDNNWGDFLDMYSQATQTLRVAPDGRHLAIQSVAPMTGYDNTDASTGAADSEVFLYDAVADSLVCVSCNPAGRPAGASTLDSSTGFFKQGTGHLTPDGKHLYFNSYDALVPADVNGTQDVYEYTGGAIRLISSGRSATDSFFGDASPDGVDVYFTTREQLVGADDDDHLDLYDARLGGGFPEPSSDSHVTCAGEACRPAASAPPALEALGSVSFSGPGNVEPHRAGLKKALGVSRISAAAQRVLARTGRLTLRVRVTGGGAVKARIRALIGRHLVTVASARAVPDSSESQIISVTLRLSPAARHRLDTHGRLRLSFTVALGGAGTKHADLTIRKDVRS